MFSQFDNKKEILVVFLVLFVFMTGLGVKIKDVVQTMKKSNRPCVVIDCGHGGIDPGKVGINGVYEKKINLAIGLYVKEALEKKNIRVVMTRKKDEGLYQDSDANKKIADLNQRIAIMDQEEPDCVISIHQNSFTGQNSRGAQVFYQTGSQNGEILAKILQEQLVSSLDTKKSSQGKSKCSILFVKENSCNSSDRGMRFFVKCTGSRETMSEKLSASGGLGDRTRYRTISKREEAEIEWIL